MTPGCTQPAASQPHSWGSKQGRVGGRGDTVSIFQRTAPQEGESYTCPGGASSFHVKTNHHGHRHQTLSFQCFSGTLKIYGTQPWSPSQYSDSTPGQVRSVCFQRAPCRRTPASGLGSLRWRHGRRVGPGCLFQGGREGGPSSAAPRTGTDGAPATNKGSYQPAGSTAPAALGSGAVGRTLVDGR